MIWTTLSRSDDGRRLCITCQHILQRYELVAAESQSQNINSNLIRPFFLSSSLSHLFFHPTQALCKILHQLQISIIFSTDSAVACGSTTSVLKSMARKNKLVFRIVFVDAAQVDAIAWQLKSMVRTMMKCHPSGKLLTEHRVLKDLRMLRNRDGRGMFVGGVLTGCGQIQTHLGRL